jgi:hypothetical protein
LPSASRAEALKQVSGQLDFFPPGKKIDTKNITKQHVVLCLNQFSNINSFASNKDILKI